MNSIIQRNVAGAFKWHIALRVEAERFTHLNYCADISVIPPLPRRFLPDQCIAVTENDAVERCTVAPYLNESRLGVFGDELGIRDK